MKLSILFIILLACPFVGAAQIRDIQFGNIWYLGYEHGLDFTGGGTGVPITHNSALKSLAGGSPVCDSTGAVLFYTDGARVWNRLHEIMPNGDSLASMRYIAAGEYEGITEETFSGASVHIIPVEGNSHLFYLFTIDYAPPDFALKYHIVDMNAAGGLGDVVKKNKVLQTDMTAGMAAVRHCNGRDWWIVGMKRVGNEHQSYLVMPDTVIQVPVSSFTSKAYHAMNGPLLGADFKISPNGKWLAGAHEFGGFELFQFNTGTGAVELLLSEMNSWRASTGLSFSADSKHLLSTYVQFDSTITDPGVPNPGEVRIVRYYLGDSDSSAIHQSGFSLLTPETLDPTLEWGELQLGADNNIYAFRSVVDSSVIPMLARTEILILDSQMDTLPERPISVYRDPGRFNILGFPTFPDAIFTNHHKASLRIPGCDPERFDSIPFFDSLLTTTRDYVWDFGDTASGVNNTSDQRHPVHAFSEPGTFTVTLRLPSECNPITISREVIVAPPEAEVPMIELAGVYLLSTSAEQYQWYLNDIPIEGASGQTYHPLENGSYKVRVTDKRGCVQFSTAFFFNSAGFNLSNPSCNIRVYPNPAGDFLYIDTDASIDAVSLVDITGKEVLNMLQSEQTLGIQSLSPGFYLVRVSMKGQVLSGRFVKE